jgi:hypothetical protein
MGSSSARSDCFCLPREEGKNAVTDESRFDGLGNYTQSLSDWLLVGLAWPEGMNGELGGACGLLSLRSAEVSSPGYAG